MLAKRMQRLGTETAFEVLARAKALEAQGRDIVHLEIGEPDFDTPQNIIDEASRPSAPATPTTVRRPACRRCARPSPSTSPRTAASTWVRTTW